jgi:hypothetical protein
MTHHPHLENTEKMARKKSKRRQMKTGGTVVVENTLTRPRMRLPQPRSEEKEVQPGNLCSLLHHRRSTPLLAFGLSPRNHPVTEDLASGLCL